MKDSDFKRKLFWDCVDRLANKGRSVAEPTEFAPPIPQRYDCDADMGMVRSAHGNWVHINDHEKLIAQAVSDRNETDFREQ